MEAFVESGRRCEIVAPVNAALPGLAGGAKLLQGSGINSVGIGFDVATAGGAALTNLDHQLFHASGLVDPRDRGIGNSKSHS